jgi:hypothetical protein
MPSWNISFLGQGTQAPLTPGIAHLPLSTQNKDEEVNLHDSNPQSEPDRQLWSPNPHMDMLSKFSEH